MTQFTVGILDFGTRAQDEDPKTIVDRTLCLAQHAEALGYSHYWLAEHHSVECCWASPEIVVALIARSTLRISVGPAGLLLSAHNPLRIACDFSLLEKLYPGRVDLGLARGIPKPNLLALTGWREGMDEAALKAIFEEKLRELLEYMPVAEQHQAIPHKPRAIPWPPKRPRIWVLGTGEVAMSLASRLGLNFAYSVLHMGMKVNPVVFEQFEQALLTQNGGESPRCSLAVAGVCAESAERASAMAKNRVDPGVYPLVVGTPIQCREILGELSETFGVTSFTFLDLAHLFEDRVESIRLLAQAVNLSPIHAPIPQDAIT